MAKNQRREAECETLLVGELAELKKPSISKTLEWQFGSLKHNAVIWSSMKYQLQNDIYGDKQRERTESRPREIRIGEQEILARDPEGKKRFEMNVVEAKEGFNFEEEVGRSCKTR